MTICLHRLNLSEFLRDERGSQTIEFILWIPVLMMLLVTVIDATTIYLAHAEMENIARDTARRMVTGTIGNEDDAEAYAQTRLSYYDYAHNVDAIWDNTNSMVVNISTEVGDVAPFGYLIQAVLTEDIYAQVAMRGDPNVTGFPSAGGGGGKPPKK
jgi:Flp pilus assembly protein TadG